jgi:HD domain
MQTQPAILKLSEAERPLGDRLLKIAVEIDRIEGYSEPHSVTIARLSERLGSLMGLHGTDLTALKYAALLHDVGERVMKRNYLLRPDDLTWEETLDLWRHPILGEQAASELKLARQVQLLIRWHHEWWNGLGYPDGLAGETIPLGARILRAVDSYCALVSKRPHRRRFDPLEAEQVIADLAGIEFDPQVAKKLVALLAKERGLQEVMTPVVAAEIERAPKEAPVVMQPAIVAVENDRAPKDAPVVKQPAIVAAEIDRAQQDVPVIMQAAVIAAEYPPETDILENIPVAPQGEPQIVELTVDAQDHILLIDEPEPVLMVEPVAVEERVEISSAAPDPLLFEESDANNWAESPEKLSDVLNVIEEPGVQMAKPPELEKRKQ